MKIQTNSSGTRSIEIEETHLQTIEKYQLLRDLIDSNGYVDEQVLDKLKLNVRSLLESQAGIDKELLDLCLDVIYHPNMKRRRQLQGQKQKALSIAKTEIFYYLRPTHLLYCEVSRNIDLILRRGRAAQVIRRNCRFFLRSLHCRCIESQTGKN